MFGNLLGGAILQVQYMPPAMQDDDSEDEIPSDFR